MKRLVVLMTVFFCWAAAYAQQDQKAKEILEKVTKSTQGYSSISASFNYVMENKAEDIHEENKGHILLQGNKYFLSLPTLGMQMYNNGETVWTYMKDANEVNIANAGDELNEAMDPAKLFTIYEHGFNYKYVEEKTVDGVPVYVIDLIPQDNQIEYSKIRIQVEKKRMLIKRAEMIGKEGNNYIVEVNDLKTDVPTKDSDFVFDKSKFKDVEVVDLR